MLVASIKRIRILQSSLSPCDPGVKTHPLMWHSQSRTIIAILPLARVAAALIELLPAGANDNVACCDEPFVLDIVFFAGGFLEVDWLGVQAYQSSVQTKTNADHLNTAALFVFFAGAGAGSSSSSSSSSSSITSSDSLATAFFPLPFVGAFFVGALVAVVFFLEVVAFFLEGSMSSDCASKSDPAASTSIIIESMEAPSSESSARAFPLP